MFKLNTYYELIFVCFDRRIAIAERSRKRDERHVEKSSNTKENHKHVPKLFSPEGRPYNINQAKVSFVLNDEDDRENVILEIAAYRHLDTSHLIVDVQPDYVRVTIKGKILQLGLPCEISITGSNAKRNVTTGNLVITMPRLKTLPVIGETARDHEPRCQSTLKRKSIKNTKVVQRQSGPVLSRREFLEIGPVNDDLDFSNIYKNRETLRAEASAQLKVKETSENFIDDPEVPPLE